MYDLNHNKRHIGTIVNPCLCCDAGLEVYNEKN